MATYTITTANWNSAADWSSISEASAGHTLDFSALPSNFSVTTSLSGIITITDGTTTYTIGEPGNDTTDANFGGSTQLDYFTTLIGSQGDDSLTGTGTGTGDLIDGSGGNDYIDASAADDTVYGGDGNDTITGGSGSDEIYGEGGDDEIIIGGNYSAHNEIVDGGTDNDTLILSPSDDRDLTVTMDETGDGWVEDLQPGSQTFSNFENITTAGGDHQINGNSSDNIRNSGSGDDTVRGGGGNDTIHAGDGNDVVYGDQSVVSRVTITIESTSSGETGDVIYQLVNDDGSYEPFQTLVTNYDANVGNSYTIFLEPGQTFAIGITSNGSPTDYHWSYENGEVQNILVAPGVMQSSFEDNIDAGSDWDYNDVVITTQIEGTAGNRPLAVSFGETGMMFLGRRCRHHLWTRRQRYHRWGQ